MKVLFDTSVIVAGTVSQHPQHSVCYDQLQNARTHHIHGYLSAHSLAEAYSVLTRLPIHPRIQADQAEQLILDLLEYMEIVPLTSTDYLTAINQMKTLNLTGGGIYDSIIAQAALKTSVDAILTLNPKHFVRLGEPIAQITQIPT